MATKYLQFTSANPELNRVQQNVAEALRHLKNNILIEAAEEAVASPLPFVWGTNALQNALRFMTPGGSMGAGEYWVPIHVAGNLTSFQVKLMTQMSSAAGAAVTFTVRVTPAFTLTPVPVPTALLLTFTAAVGGQYVYGRITGSVPVVVGDLLSVSVLDVNYGSGAILASATVELTPS